MSRQIDPTIEAQATLLAGHAADATIDAETIATALLGSTDRLGSDADPHPQALVASAAAPTLGGGARNASENHTSSPTLASVPSLPDLVVIDKTLGEPRGPVGGLDRIDLELIGTLGEGGMGVVRRARQVSMDREVAVKTLRTEVEIPPERARGLLIEGLITGRLEHPNIVPVHAIGRDDSSRPLVVMKCIEGASWRSLLTSDPASSSFWTDEERTSPELRLERHLEIAIQVCRALEYAHDRRTIHRDIKPENVMLGAYGEVYVVDWGIAVDLDTIDASDALSLAGTPAYMAPEMVLGDPDAIDERTDIYLLGATLYEVLSGTPPHAGDGLIGLIQTILAKDGVDVETGHPELAQIVRRATRARPADRFATVAELRTAIATYMRHRTSHALTDRADESRARLSALLESDTVDHAERHELLLETQFGYRSALDQWAENERARDGLSACITVMFEYALDHDELDLARSLYHQIDEPSAAMTRRLDDLQSAHDKRREASSELAALRHESSFSVAGKGQTLFFIGFVVFGLFVSTYALATGDEVTVLTHGQLLFFLSLMGGLAGAAAVVFRATLMANRIARNVMFSVFAAIGVMFVHRLIAAYIDIPPNTVLMHDLLLEGLACLIGAAAMGRSMALCGSSFVGFAILAAWIPERTPELFSIAHVVVPIPMVYLFHRKVVAEREG